MNLNTKGGDHGGAAVPAASAAMGAAGERPSAGRRRGFVRRSYLASLRPWAPLRLFVCSAHVFLAAMVARTALDGDLPTALRVVATTALPLLLGYLGAAIGSEPLYRSQAPLWPGLYGAVRRLAWGWTLGVAVLGTAGVAWACPELPTLAVAGITFGLASLPWMDQRVAVGGVAWPMTAFATWTLFIFAGGRHWLPFLESHAGILAGLGVVVGVSVLGTVLRPARWRTLAGRTFGTLVLAHFSPSVMQRAAQEALRNKQQARRGEKSPTQTWRGGRVDGSFAFWQRAQRYAGSGRFTRPWQGVVRLAVLFSLAGGLLCSLTVLCLLWWPQRGAPFADVLAGLGGFALTVERPQGTLGAMLGAMVRMLLVVVPLSALFAPIGGLRFLPVHRSVCAELAWREVLRRLTCLIAFKLVFSLALAGGEVWLRGAGDLGREMQAMVALNAVEACLLLLIAGYVHRSTVNMAVWIGVLSALSGLGAQSVTSQRWYAYLLQPAAGVALVLALGGSLWILRWRVRSVYMKTAKTQWDFTHPGVNMQGKT